MGSNEKIRIGVVGVNSRGNALAMGFARQKGCEIGYVCDVDSRAMNKCIATIDKLTGKNPTGKGILENYLN